ncbi:unnamed protein product [Linum tenue]|uniref:ATP-dependent DNA helicase n=1 Tax=Linum tenue TaxID=586396 RepID=A0AAV0KWB5_9ROSI|nr:unnamed protein product [Linum tenue]
MIVASSGIAATLLPNASTAHSRFKIPLEIDQTSTCSIRKGTRLATSLAEADLIIWDEAPGEGYKPFGGKTVLLGGDFRQTLPVVPNAGREESVDSSLTRSYLWNFCTVLHLSRNMRVNSAAINQQTIFDGMTFADWTLAIGNGQIHGSSFKKDQPPDWIPIPPVCLLPPSSEPTSTICDHIYTDFSRSYHQASYLTARAIVTPTNKNVTEINDHMLERVRGRTHSYFSEIGLKIFAPVMLLRNLNPEIGLCNGTRIMVTYLTTYVIKGLIMGGAYAGRQFPVRLCYAMTINKSQGQTLDRVGVFLPKPVFSHGQLYVAVSRVRSAEGLKFLIENEDHIPAGYTRNIVYNETFDSLGGSSCSIPPHATRFVQCLPLVNSSLLPMLYTDLLHFLASDLPANESSSHHTNPHTSCWFLFVMLQYTISCNHKPLITVPLLMTALQTT